MESCNMDFRLVWMMDDGNEIPYSSILCGVGGV